MITNDRRSAMRETATQMKDGDNRFAINLREAAHSMIDLLDALDESLEWERTHHVSGKCYENYCRAELAERKYKALRVAVVLHLSKPGSDFLVANDPLSKEMIEIEAMK